MPATGSKIAALKGKLGGLQFGAPGGKRPSKPKSVTTQSVAPSAIGSSKDVTGGTNSISYAGPDTSTMRRVRSAARKRPSKKLRIHTAQGIKVARSGLGPWAVMEDLLSKLYPGTSPGEHDMGQYELVVVRQSTGSRRVLSGNDASCFHTLDSDDFVVFRHVDDEQTLLTIAPTPTTKATVAATTKANESQPIMKEAIKHHYELTNKSESAAVAPTKPKATRVFPMVKPATVERIASRQHAFSDLPQAATTTKTTTTKETSKPTTTTQAAASSTTTIETSEPTTTTDSYQDMVKMGLQYATTGTIATAKFAFSAAAAAVGYLSWAMGYQKEETA